MSIRLNEQCGACQSWRWCGRTTCKIYKDGKVPGHPLPTIEEPTVKAPPLPVEEIREVAAAALERAPKSKMHKHGLSTIDVMTGANKPGRKRAAPVKRTPLPAAHPDCKRCAALNVRAAERMRKIRASE